MAVCNPLDHLILLHLMFHPLHTSAELYNALYRYLLTRDDVLELTIEDPAEAFEDLRDKNDLQMLLASDAFTREGTIGSRPTSRGKLGPPADKAWAEKWRVQLKIAKVSTPPSLHWRRTLGAEMNHVAHVKRQFQRLVEMLILRSLRPQDVKATRAFRLQAS
jgi:histone acetyltransferase 1